jgi:hypothetical protein
MIFKLLLDLYYRCHWGERTRRLMLEALIFVFISILLIACLYLLVPLLQNVLGLGKAWCAGIAVLLWAIYMIADTFLTTYRDCLRAPPGPF